MDIEWLNKIFCKIFYIFSFLMLIYIDIELLCTLMTIVWVCVMLVGCDQEWRPVSQHLSCPERV